MKRLNEWGQRMTEANERERQRIMGAEHPYRAQHDQWERAADRAMWAGWQATGLPCWVWAMTIGIPIAVSVALAIVN